MSALATVAQTIRQNPVFRLYRHYIIDSILIVKNQGFKELARRRGMKFLYVIIGYYLVRDTLLYVIIPLAVAGSLF